MKFLLAIILVFMLACGGGVPVLQYQVSMSALSKVEKRKLPERPDAEDIPPEKDWVFPIDEGVASPADGILLSEEKAVRAKKWQLGYEELLGLFEADRKVWVETRIIYEERLTMANQEIKRLQPNWWDSNKGTVGWISGVAAGAIITIFIVYGVDQATGQE